MIENQAIHAVRNGSHVRRSWICPNGKLATVGVIAVENVNYEESSNFHISGSIEPNEEAKRVLSRKLATWRHEQEVRVFTHSTYFPVSIKYVYLGCKMESETEALLRPMITRLLPKLRFER